MREQALVLSRMWYTPAPYWLSMTLRELRDWIRSSNETLDKFKPK